MNKRQLAAVVDRAGHRQDEIDLIVDEARELRAKLLSLGRCDLARRFVTTPTYLRDFADYLWFNKAWVSFEKRDPPQPQQRIVSTAQFKEKFTMTRQDGGPSNSEVPGHERRKSALARHSEAIWMMWLAKKNSDVQDRIRKAKKAGRTVSVQALEREAAIETGWLFPLEEWATIFPDAALAGDYDFIERIVQRFKEKDVRPLFRSPECQIIALFWHGFEYLGAVEFIPPLKNWTDKAACEFIRFMSPDNRAFDVRRYKQWKSDLGLKRERPTLVSEAEYEQRGATHTLKCRR